MNDIWILVQHRDLSIEEVTFGLIAEARRMAADLDQAGDVTAVAIGKGLEEALPTLGAYGADRVICLRDYALAHYHGEIFASELARLLKQFTPSYLLMAQSAETDDLAPRLAALLETALVTRAVDLKPGDGGKPVAIRAISNGYLFEEVFIEHPAPAIISFIPSVLTPDDPHNQAQVEVRFESMSVKPDGLRTKLVDIIEAGTETMDLEEADIIISGGRGVGQGRSFDIIRQLAAAIGGSIGGTRPVIDRQILPFESQIGQTGKTVTPRLMFNCGISGANEYTAGMEKARLVITINKDPSARIFRFSDLGVIGDVHEILPPLIEQVKESKDSD
ncbi:Electron transfer flavoprotein, alpha subunit [Olavius sp. associated proteobacterium Delta 1]|nr:Electron transfer flavoprotein, alpha subunit [Olavius sp. associated proteobacterium Delta 1]